MIQKESNIELQSFDILRNFFEIKSNSIRLQDKEGNRAIKANIDIPKNQKIIEIPEKYFIHERQRYTGDSPLIKYLNKLSSFYIENEETCLFPDQLKKMLSGFCFVFKDIHSLVYLLQKRFMREKFETDAEVDQVHYCYINLLPKNYDYHPIHCMNELQFAHKKIYQIVKEQSDTNRRIADMLSSIINNKYTICSFEDFLIEYGKEQKHKLYLSTFSTDNILWGLNVLQTRQFQAGLIPLLDLFNHEKEPNADYLFEQGKSVSLYSLRDIAKDQEIFVNYGLRTIQNIFCNYGFISANDACQLIIPVSLFSKTTIKIKVEQKFSSFWMTQIVEKWKEEQCFFGIRQDTLFRLEQFMNSCIAERDAKEHKIRWVRHLLPALGFKEANRQKIAKQIIKILQIQVNALGLIIKNREEMREKISLEYMKERLL